MNDRDVISDAAWGRIGPLLPSDAGRRGRRFRDHRVVVEAIVWKYRTGSPWRGPAPAVRAVADRLETHATWSGDGTWDRVEAAAAAIPSSAASPKLKQWRGIPTRYDKTATNYRGGLVLATLPMWTQPQ